MAPLAETAPWRNGIRGTEQTERGGLIEGLIMYGASDGYSKARGEVAQENVTLCATACLALYEFDTAIRPKN